MIELHSKMVKAPPRFIFDMFNSFNSTAIYENLGLKYEMLKIWPGNHYVYHLYKHVNTQSIPNINFDFKSVLSTGKK